MLAFLTSFRARSLAKDWNYHVWMLDRMLTSVLAQTQGEVRAVVACHDVPPSAYADHPKVSFVPVGFSPPERNFDDMCADKVLKVSIAARRALELGCDYIMIGDADDLVSNRIGTFIANHAGKAGWYGTDTMFYSYGSQWLRSFHVSELNSVPSVILRSDTLTFDAPPFSGPWVDMVTAGGEAGYLTRLGRHGVEVNTQAAVGLAHYRALAAAEGRQLDPLPFAPMIMINHIESVSHVPGGIGSYHEDGPRRPAWRRFLGNIRQGLLKLPSMRRVTSQLRLEYSIPADSQIPHEYLTRGSLFWR